MKLKNQILFFLLLLLSSTNILWAQNKIHFADITIKAATQRANIEDKNIFVDTYAPWCGPCKIMDIHFQDKEVVNYFNRNFINVKIDTDTPYGKKMSTKYQVAFLPTLLILTKDGATRFKVDKLINRDELLSLAKLAIEGPKNPRPVNPPPPSKKEVVVVKPTPKKAEKQVQESPMIKNEVGEKQTTIAKEESAEKILYVLDKNATNLPPEILYEEAYFRLQLNDGSQKEAAQKYLATQENWNSEKNLKFIFDFLYDTDSDEFAYFVSNKELFQKVISEEKIQRSLKILVENKLYQGIPRPDFERSKFLLSLIDAEHSEKNNYHYFLNRLHLEKKQVDFNNLCNEYFKLNDKYNQEIVINYISGKLTAKSNKSKLRSHLGLLELIEEPEDNYSLLLLYSKLYFRLSDRANAIAKANKAIEIGQLEQIDIKEAKKILENIKEL